MATSGMVVLGSSAIAPVLTDWIDNQDGASWLTLDNRLGQAIGVAPAWAEGSPDLPIPLTCPALRRTTVPIDPGKGVQVSVLDTQQLTGTPNYLQVEGFELFAAPLIAPPGGPTVRYAKRTIPYLLHDAGAAPSDLLYPPETWVPSTYNVAVSGPGGVGAGIYWVGQQPNAAQGLALSQQLAYVPADTPIMAATFTLMPGSTVSQSVWGGVTCCLIGDLFTNPPGLALNNAIGQQLIFSTYDQVGATVTIPCLGCAGLGLGLSSAITSATEEFNYQLVIWLGVPAE